MQGAIDPDDILIDRREDPAIADLYHRVFLRGDPALDEITGGAPAIIEMTACLEQLDNVDELATLLAA